VGFVTSAAWLALGALSIWTAPLDHRARLGLRIDMQHRGQREHVVGVGFEASRRRLHREEVLGRGDCHADADAREHHLHAGVGAVGQQTLDPVVEPVGWQAALVRHGARFRINGRLRFKDRVEITRRP
jgi:hypothetical protein